MVGRTNASAGGGTEMELIWTNKTPSQSMNNLTLSIKKCFGVVVLAKRFTGDGNTTWASNFCQNGHTERLAGYTPSLLSSARSITVTDSQLTITLDSGADNRNTIPLKIYLIV